MIRRLLYGAVVVLAACGGAGTGTPSGPVARTAGGQTVTTAEGAPVTQEAHNRWTEAMALFSRHEQQGWNESRCAEAVHHFEEAIDVQRDFAEAHYMAGVVHMRCHQEERAYDFFDRALQANPKLCSARSAMGLRHLKADRISEATSEFERAIRDDPQCTEAYVNLAAVQRRREATEGEAVSNLRRALAIESDYLPAFNEMALLYLGQSARDAAKLDLAGVVCRQAQQINVNYAPIYNTWGLINMKKGNIIEALQMFDRARRLDDSMFEAQMNFGEITLSFRGYEDAKTSFTRATELEPDNYEAQLGLGAALRGLRDVEQAKNRYDRAIEIDGRRPEAYFNLGILYQDYMSGSIQDLDRAKGYYEQFLSRSGSRSDFTDEVQSINRRCNIQQGQGRQRRRVRRDCQPGRMQNLTMAREALSTMQEMEQQQAPAGGGGR